VQLLVTLHDPSSYGLLEEGQWKKTFIRTELMRIQKDSRESNGMCICKAKTVGL
jgi:hypothetical protein